MRGKISFENARTATRGTLTEVVWVVPCSSPERADYSRVFPAVSRDLCTEGVGVVHNAPITEPCVDRRLERRDRSPVHRLLAEALHALGYGFYHIGLFAEEIIEPDAEEIEAMCTSLEKYDSAAENRQEAANAR